MKGSWVANEYTLVIDGTLRVTTREGTFDVGAGEAILMPKGERVRDS